MNDEKKPGVIRRFFRALTKFITALRLLVLNLAFIFFLVILFVIFTGGHLPKIPEQGALILNIEGTLVDQKTYIDPITLLMEQSDPEQREILLRDVIDAINHAKNDQRINTIVLALDYFVYGGISKIQEVAEALQTFRATGKKVIAVGDNYSQDQYLLAAQADEIYVHPMGAVMIEGYGVFRNYFKTALDKLDINFHVFRVGEFKSAMEPVMRDSMSEEAKDANLQWLSVLWDRYAQTVAEARGLKAADVNRYVNEADEILDRYQGNTATMAVASGLVNGIKTRDEMNQYLIKQVGAQDEDGYYQGVTFEAYLWLTKLERSQHQAEEKVGLIVAAGNILDGYQPAGTIGGDSTAELIREARIDPDVHAVVMRIDSGGGSAFASEIIRRELQLLQQAGKPLVVSMGSVAASGGYWISASADQIFALPTTITGSIGIFGVFPTIDETLAGWGINSDGVGTTKLAGAMRIDRPLSPMVSRMIQSNIEHGYSRFLDVVAEGRDMTRDEVAKIAEGRVWAGVDAKTLGLVDELGGLSQAVAAAAALAELKNYSTKLIEPSLTPQEQLIRQLTGGEAARQWLPALGSAFRQSGSVLGQVERWLTPFRSQLDYVQQMNDPQGVYLHCTVCVAP